MKPQIILFDLDDTLSHCNKYFDLITDEFACTMVRWFEGSGYSKENILEKQREIDMMYVKQFGLTSEHFKRSFVETYLYFCDKTKSVVETKKVVELTELAMSVYDQEFEPFPHMYDVLDSLKREGHSLCLHTGGEDEIQKKKVKQLELSAYFGDNVFISKHKDTKALERVLNTVRGVREETWMIGNSLRTDIRPALQVGINAIYIPTENEWNYNIVDIDIQPKSEFLTLQSLIEVPHTINKVVKQKLSS